MQPSDKLAKILSRFEPVEWCYDGLNGKVIKWTEEHGNKNHDPSVLAFVVGRDGKVFASLMNGQQYNAGGFSKWALEQADAYEKLHPSTRMPFVRCKVVVSGSGEATTSKCSAVDTAREAKKPMLLYFGRGHFEANDKPAKKQNKLARSFEKKTLNSKTAAKQVKGWALFRFDLADEAHAEYAKALGVTAAPAILLWAVGAEKPTPLDRKISGHGLAALLKKHKAK